MRILPGYWLALTVLGLMAGLVGVRGEDLWRHILLIQAYDPKTAFSGLIVTWSLSIEWGLYALLPVFAAVTLFSAQTRSRTDWWPHFVAVLVLIALVELLRLLTWSDLPHSWRTVTKSAILFACGMALAVLSVRAQIRRKLSPDVVDSGVFFPGRWPGTCWSMAAVVFMVNVEGVADSEALEFVLEAAFAVLIVAPAAASEIRTGVVSRLLRSRMLAWVGLISFGLYLWHDLLIFRLRAGSTGVDAVGRTLAAIALTFACASVSYYALERPLMRRLKR